MSQQMAAVLICTNATKYGPWKATFIQKSTTKQWGEARMATGTHKRTNNKRRR